MLYVIKINKVLFDLNIFPSGCQRTTASLRNVDSWHSGGRMYLRAMGTWK